MVSTKIFQVTPNHLLILFQWYSFCWWWWCNKNPCPSIRTFQLRSFQPVAGNHGLSILHSAGRFFCRRVEGAQITIAGLVPMSQGNGSKNSASVEPQNYWLATLGYRVTSSNPVTPSSPATLVHQHPVSLPSPGKTLWMPRACPDPHSKGFHEKTSQRRVWAHSTCASAQTASYGLSWSKTLWAPLCKG